MYHNLLLKCSECGSFRSERFENADRVGIRCLTCGHENALIKENYHSKHQNTSWELTVEESNEF